MSRRAYHAVIAAAALSLAVPVRAEPETYRFDPVHSQVWFRVSHLHFSNPLGRLRIREGWFQFDPKDWSAARVDVTIDLASVDMGDAKWDDAIKSGQFFDVGRWPTARFYSMKVEATDASSGVIHGELALHGTTRPVDVEYRLNRTGNDPYTFKQKAGFSAHAKIDRRDFGMKRYQDVVGDDIEITIEIEGIRDRNAAAPSARDEKK